MPPLLEPIASKTESTYNEGTATTATTEDSSPSSQVKCDTDSEALQWHWPLDASFVQLFAQRGSRMRGTQSTADDDSKSEASSVSAYQPSKAAEMKIELLDAKRSYNVSISLTHIRLSFTQIHSAILTFDASLLSQDTVDVLLDCMPTHDEKLLLAGYDGAHAQLGHVEQFMAVMSSPASLHTRLISLAFMHAFSATSHTLADSLTVVQHAFDAVRQSTNFQQLLGLVLRCGNHLNALNNVQQVYGFDLSSLHMIRGVKTADNATTLLHWLIDYIN